jgi:arabinan endo-1,5-alpha-L-arabinosidase
VVVSLATVNGIATSATAQLTGQLSAHDPSTLIQDGGTYRYFATGNGIVARRSTNMVSWSTGATVFSAPPAWTTAAVPGFTGNFWAPDVAFFDGEYHLYYSVSTFGSQVSAIGLATNPTLDPTSPNYAWTDQGPVIQSTSGSAYNTIDPAIFKDTDGRIWMSFGSFWNGIYMTELDPSTGKRLSTTTAPSWLARKSEIEAPFIFKRDGYYYLFVNWGFCCRGVNSTYNIRVGRSTSVEGPYFDEGGVNMVSGGGSLFLDTEANRIGPGHIGIFSEEGQDWFSYHFYDANASGAARYNLRRLYWDSSAWPTANPSAVNATWTGATDARWSQPGNWAGSVPDGAGQSANFGSISSGRFTVAIDGGAKTVNPINFDSPASYTIGVSGGDALILDAASDNAAINVTSGSHTIAAPVTLSDGLDVNVSPSTSRLTISGNLAAAGRTVNKFGAGAIEFQNVRAAALNVNSGVVRIIAKPQSGDATGTSVVNDLSIAPGGAVLDLTNNSVIIDYAIAGTLVDEVRQHLSAGRLTSSAADAGHALGYADNSVLGLTSFAGQTVDPTALLIKFAMAADANLDDAVDIADLGALARNWQTSNVWTGGDFDYSGFVDIADLGMLAGNWQAGSRDLSDVLVLMGLPTGAVPEPFTTSALFLSLARSLKRPHRRHRFESQNPRITVLERRASPCFGSRFSTRYSIPCSWQNSRFSGLSPSSFTA